MILRVCDNRILSASRLALDGIEPAAWVCFDMAISDSTVQVGVVGAVEGEETLYALFRFSADLQAISSK